MRACLHYNPLCFMKNLVAVWMTLAFLVPAALELRAEVPPSIEKIFPADGEKNVPLNTQIWIYGESMPEGSPVKAELYEEASGALMPLTLKIFPAMDLSRARTEKLPEGAVGASGYRYLYTAVLSVPLKANTLYRIQASVLPFSEVSAVFETGNTQDLEPPSKNSRNFSGVFKETVRTEIYSEKDGSKKLESFILSDNVPAGCYSALRADLAGNKEEFSECSERGGS